MKLESLVAVAAVWCVGVGVGWADSWAPPPGPQLAYSVALEKDQFEVGEPIVLNMELVNLGEQDYLVQTSSEETGGLDGYTLMVSGRDGQVVERPAARLPPIKSLGSWDSIPRYARYERRLFLNYWVRPLAPGRYVVRAWYNPRAARPGKPGDGPVLEAVAREFEIVATTPEKLGARVKRMSEESKGGDVLAMDFLGFTGAAEATGELLDRVYDDEPQAQRRAANALGYLSDQEQLQRAAIDAARSRGAPPVFAAWLCAQSIEADTLVPIFLSYATAKDLPARIGALTGLRLLHDSPLVRGKYRQQVRAAGLAGLKDSRSEVRLAAVLLLGFDGGAEVVAALQELLRDETYSSVKRAAEITLKKLRG